MIVRRIHRQLSYGLSQERPASILRKLYLRLKYDCYISLGADIFHPHNIVLDHGVRIYRYANLTYTQATPGTLPALELEESHEYCPMPRSFLKKAL